MNIWGMGYAVDWPGRTDGRRLCDGLVAAGISGTLDSRVGWKGILKKVLIFVTVAVAAVMDRVTGMETSVLRSAAQYDAMAVGAMSQRCSSRRSSATGRSCNVGTIKNRRY